jgi:hypothetical protein
MLDSLVRILSLVVAEVSQTWASPINLTNSTLRSLLPITVAKLLSWVPPRNLWRTRSINSMLANTIIMIIISINHLLKIRSLRVEQPLTTRNMRVDSLPSLVFLKLPLRLYISNIKKKMKSYLSSWMSKQTTLKCMRVSQTSYLRCKACSLQSFQITNLQIGANQSMSSTSMSLWALAPNSTQQFKVLLLKFRRSISLTIIPF